MQCLTHLGAWGENMFAQVSYQVGCYDIATDASAILWKHFVAEPPPPQQITYVTSAKIDFKLTLHR